jgi:dimethylamine corrinoid protein
MESINTTTQIITSNEGRSIMLDLTLLTSAIGDLDEEEILSMLNEFAAAGPDKTQAARAIEACQKGMETVGRRFETGEYFVGDLIYAGELLTESMDILKPVIGSATEQKIGKIVLGTVEGDLHDIGKNIFKSMAEAAGFEVYDLGINVPAERFVEKVKEVQPDILGLSGVLTMAVTSMKEAVDSLKENGLRDNIKITIGGACASYEAMQLTGADAWSTNAAETVNVCRSWVSQPKA